jgi:hypothetical protein
LLYIVVAAGLPYQQNTAGKMGSHVDLYAVR